MELLVGEFHQVVSEVCIDELQVSLYVVLCPDMYFSTTTLADQLRATTIDNVYWNKGHIWLHEW
jgi:hypothetical protein